MTRDQIKAELRHSAIGPDSIFHEPCPDWWWPTLNEFRGPDEMMLAVTRNGLRIFWLIVAEAL